LARLTFAVPGGLDVRTGGTIYDSRVVDALRADGWRVDVLEWPASFPFPDEDERRAVAASLASLPDGTLVMIDGLALGTLPALARQHAARLRLVAMVHHPLAMEAGLPLPTAERLAAEEREALQHVRAIIVTSATTAATLTTEFAVPPERITIAVPGIDRRTTQSVHRRSGPIRVLSVGHVAPRKAHHVLVEALSIVADLDFSCVIAGSLDRHPETAAALAHQIVHLGLSDRVRLAGEVGEEGAARLYADADLFALASVYEGYGMVFTEAMAWGLPIVATTGGAIPEAVPPEAGLLVPPGDAAAFADALRIMLSDARRRASLAEGARCAAGRLDGWDATGATIAATLNGLQRR